MATQGGNLKSTSINGVKVYSISQRNLPTWLNPKKKRALRKDPHYQQRVELVQDLRFETATSRIKITPNEEYVIASGIYPPQVKVYELRELSMKFERHFDSEIIDFQILDDDYSKLAFLCADRSVCLHAKYGKHYTLRIPRMGRDIEYDCWSCDLFCAASSPDLYRINLEKGQFLKSFNTRSPALNVVSRSKVHGLVACGGEDGAVECFDPRVESSVGRIDAVAPSGDTNQEVTALEFDGDGGFLMAVGSSGGKVLLYDLRSSNPIRIKDHLYGSPILDIKWHSSLNSEGRKLITTDSHIVRIWDPETGEGMTSIEPNGGAINDICIFSNSGLMLLALDGSHIPSYFIPSLGPAPKWIASLENLTEELEENAQTTVYDNFKFLTKEDLERLNMTKYIGTNHLRAYMHGFFVDYRLYQREKAKADPFEYEAYIEKRKQEKLEEQRASRITIAKKLPKVNRSLAASILEKETENERKDAEAVENKKGSKKNKGLGTDIFHDERFGGMFENKEYEIDETSQEYLALHPVAATTKQPSSLAEYFEPIAEEDEDQDQDFSSSDDDIKGKSRVPRLYEVKDERHAEAFRNSVSLAEEDSLPIGERLASLGDVGRDSGIDRKKVKFGPGGSREISFISRSSGRFNREDKEDHQEGGGRNGRKRGVEALGLKKDRSAGFRGRGRGSRGRGRGRR
ncbi:unnamed protein product [Linum tenue]|uniref:Nucleolar protein 10 n=1 Tax=Linum tenue TaxID=586396 RepID=A0AAV0S080_9ROSI|nr:unnamed protein product [Linum tenue]